MIHRFYILLLLIMFIVGSSIIAISPTIEMSKIEKRTLFKREDFKMNTEIDKQVNSILKDQFYSRENLIKIYYQTKLLCNKVPYKMLSGMKKIKSDIDTGVVYLANNVIDLGDGYLMNNVLTYAEDKAKEVQQRGYNINEISLLYPDISFYVYFPTRIEETLNIEDTNYGLNYRYLFLQQLNDSIKTDALKIDSIEEYKNYFYKSDFHWNARGAYRAYSDIINLIKKDYDIDSPKEIKNELLYESLWHGNISGLIGQITKEDNITDIELKDIGNYSYYINDELSDYGTHKEIYKDSGNPTSYSDYDYYYGDNVFEKRFEFHDSSKPNILVFRDSLCNVNEEWIASHFNTTVFIDLRLNDGSFHLEDYIKKYSIDIVLVTEIYSNLYFNGNMFIPTD